MYSYQGTWTSNDGESATLEIDLPTELESKVKVHAIFDELKCTMVGTYNKKSKMLNLESENGYVASIYTTPLTIVGNVLNNTIVGTFKYNMSGSFELTYYSKEDIEKRNKNIKIKKIKDIIKAKEKEHNKIMTEISELVSQLADLENPKRKVPNKKIHSDVLIVNCV
uniref:Uncharacterized protein n=1 Tax=Pithovirus LCPAC401 TaxID=2506595 RepID=A0A481ZC15_9VIRU|nr:MAG: uncharacterized protein LCPAC401_02670 [Pithovirus LCPAC401]